jgi:hypothetical protein
MLGMYEKKARCDSMKTVTENGEKTNKELVHLMKGVFNNKRRFETF